MARMLMLSRECMGNKRVGRSAEERPACLSPCIR